MQSDFAGTDLMVFQLQPSQNILATMRMAKRMGIVCAVEADDDFMSANPELDVIADNYYKPEIRAIMLSFLQEADAVIVSTRELAGRMGTRTNKPIHVVMNTVDVANWDWSFHQRLLKSNPGKPETVTIGWMASQSHIIDIPLVQEALARILHEEPNVQAHIIGLLGADKLPMLKDYGSRVKIEGWVEISKLPEIMEDMDIGLAPLIDTAYNRAKSGIKAMQYGALGIPCLCSPLPPYEDFPTAHVPGNAPGAWYDQIKRLVQDREIRKSAGMAARLDVLRKWDIRMMADVWHETYRKIVAAGQRT
jgi:glycosyltransferase involved in cell wall biosynthesis